MTLIWLFWIAVLIVGYIYIGYAIVLWLLVKSKSNSDKEEIGIPEAELPEVTFVVAAYNEADIIEEKIQNTFDLDYPKDKMQLIFVTDGSSDNTPEIINQYPEIELYHNPPRNGKIAAVNRIMPMARHDITIYSDANAMLNKESIRNIVKHYQDEKVGAVAGEKRVLSREADSASAAGESLYWRYESTLRHWDAQLCSVMGAAGELFSIRTKLYENIAEDTLIEDFYLTMSFIRKGYKIAYAPDAYAMETASENTSEELKRKIRISAGGLQASWRLRDLMNPFRYPLISFQLISHRVMRWTLGPLCLLLLAIIHPFLAFQLGGIYSITLILHLTFYILALFGWLMARRNLKIKVLFVPYYFLMMNYSVFMGLNRLIKGKQSTRWDKAKRKSYSV